MAVVQNLHKTLLTEWDKSKKNVNRIEQIIQQLEEELQKLDVLKELTPLSVTLIHKDFFEISALYYVYIGDLVKFEHGITKVNCFYSSEKTESVNKCLMIGLYLMHLLSSNRVSEFHTILEQIDQSIQQQNPLIRTPVELEQFLVEGAYNKIMLNRHTLPSPFYAGFIQLLIDTVRNEIASCLEKSYKVIQFKDACSMLLFDNEKETVEFGNARSWKVNSKSFQFENVSGHGNNTNLTQISQLDTKRIIQQNLYYAKQLEMII